MAHHIDTDIDEAHEADMRALRAEQLAADIDLDHEFCAQCARSLRACICCHTCGCVETIDGLCECSHEHDAAEDDAAWEAYYAELEHEDEQRALFAANRAAPAVKPALLADPDYLSDDPFADRDAWRARRVEAFA